MKQQQVWAIRFWLDQHRRLRDRALFDFAINSKLRGCDVVKVRIEEPLETAVLSIPKDQLLTDQHGKLFVETFKQELRRLSVSNNERDEVAHARLAVLDVELANLARYLKAETIPQMLLTMIDEAEAEKIVLTARLSAARPLQASRRY